MEWVVKTMPRSHYSRKSDPVPIVYEAGWAPASVKTGAENLVPNGIRSKVDVTNGISMGFKSGVSLKVPQNIGGFYLYNYALQPLRLIVRSCLVVPTFATRHFHACYHSRAPSGGRWNCGREMSGNFA